jgi:methyl-accepting chemotaxis protein
MGNDRIRKRRMGLVAKIAMLPFIGLLALFFVEVMDQYLAAKVGRASALGQYGSSIAWMMTERVLNETEYLNRSNDKVLKQIDEQSTKITQTLGEAKRLDNDTQIKNLLVQIENAALEHEKAFKVASKVVSSLSQSKAQFMAQLNNTDQLSKKAVVDLINEQSQAIMFNGTQLSDKKVSLISGLKELTGFISAIILNVNELFTSSDTERFEKMGKELSEKMKICFSNNAGIVAAANDPKYSDYWEKIKAEYALMGKTQDVMYDQWKQLQVASTNLEKTNRALKQSIESAVTETKKQIVLIEHFGNWFSWVTIGLTTLLMILLSIMVIRSITRPIKSISRRLNEGANQVAAASGQISSASQALAEGSSEQAASIEETSSSLEEMSSMTKQSADNANQANVLMEETKQIVGKANESMGRLTTSMEEISRASEETSKIIKTIDEIAFQTNLLALNAAVEAARAGEAGAGFAVVADEVRNLAMRAADAAKNTANLIEGTVKKVKDGSGLLGTTNQAFQEVSTSAAKVADLVAEIAAASNEQSQGIDQLNKAVAEMDKVVQRNAANAEESASASEEMNAQAERMNEMVGELVAMSAGARLGSSTKSLQTARHGAEDKGRKAPSSVGEKGQRYVLAVSPKHEVSPGQVIPFDEEDFKKF